MKQTFSFEQHKQFKQLLSIKDIPSEIENNFISDAKKYMKYIAWIPWIEMVWIGNSISMNCANGDSDIDLYIVTQRNRLWLVRILVTGIFQILGKRKTPDRHAGRFCLSFFSTREGMDFWKFALEYDPYLYFWIVHFKPIINNNYCYESFLWANSWADFSEYSDIIKDNYSYISKKKTTSYSTNFLLNFIDGTLKKIFLPKTLDHFESIWKPYGVIINDDLLKFHNGDLRKDIAKKIS